jgi:cobalamin-dependent methionine synthase I
MRSRDPKPIQDFARAETKAGVDYLDLNIGPARTLGDEMMAFVVKTVQEVTALPLSLDTTNPVAMEAGLKVCKSRALMNSVSLQPDRLAAGLPLVTKYNADVIGLLWGAEGMPRDANERCMLAVDFVYKANEAGVTNDRIWIDPIMTPVCVEINQVKACFEFMSMLADVAPGCKSTVGLSNVSNGTPTELRPYLNRTAMIMLMKYGLHSAIVDAFDEELVKIGHGQMPEIVKLVHGMMDGNMPDPARLSPKELEHYKTYNVITGKNLYSHSWLQI